MTFPTFQDWGWDFPIQINDDGITPPNESSIGAGFLEGDLCIVTLQMWMGSGSTPVFKLGRYVSGFVDETSSWTALPAITNGHAYARSFYRVATSAMASDGDVGYTLDSYSPPSDGGAVGLHVFRGASTPTIAYQDTADGSLDPTPAEDPDDPILHTYFGRSAWQPGSTNAPHIQPFDYAGTSGGHFSAQTIALQDNGNLSTHIFADIYGVGFYFPLTTDLPGAGGAYDGHITWDMTTTTSSGGLTTNALGAQTAVIQGIRVPAVAVAQNFMMIL